MVFNTALSGIQAASRGLDVIGHNIANASTWGFKSSRAEFQDVFSSGAFGGSLTSVGSGVRLSQVQQNFNGGSLLPTGNSLDMGIDGTGFMILNDQGRRVYTRAGAFHPDSNGYIINSNHQRLVGKLSDGNGNITNTMGDLLIDKSNISPKASTSVKAGVNLNSKDTIPGIPWAGGAAPSQDSYSSKTTTTLYDSLGNSHILSMYFIKSDASALAGAPNASSPPGTENQWYVAFQLDNQNIPANVGTTNSANLFRANFNQDGSFSGVQDVTGTALANNLIPLGSNLANGSNPLALNIDLSPTTQYGSDFSVQSLSYDGYSTGKLGGLFIGDDGVLFGSYSNNQSRAMGQIQLADFANPNGLQSLGGVSWAETSESGQSIINNPGSGTLGFVKSGQLEESNVDLTSELVGLISAQRNFQANAQTIKSGDAITQTIINIR